MFRKGLFVTISWNTPYSYLHRGFTWDDHNMNLTCSNLNSGFYSLRDLSIKGNKLPPTHSRITKSPDPLFSLQ